MFGRKKKEKTSTETPEIQQPKGLFSTDIFAGHMPRGNAFQYMHKRTFQQPLPVIEGVAMDACNPGANALRNAQNFGGMPESLMLWYAAQGFIGYQLMAMIAQHYLVDKVCTMPGRDAIRNGFETTVNDGTEVDVKKLDLIKELDKKYRLDYNLIQFVRFGRIFGIRHLLFQVDSSDPEYYVKPFNIDGVKKGSYRGMSQIDPYWIAPMLDAEAASNPAARDFYEPTYWIINGQRYHRSHFEIFRTNEVADILKPTYFYGGVSVTQKIYERVYAAERTANEAPQLATTKRLITLKADLTQVEANPEDFEKKLQTWTTYMNNYGVKVLGLDEVIEQHDTSLADLDAVTMTMYQLVAGAGDIPITKLIGTTPKGFNATGEFDEASYHEMLESIQENDLTAVVNRHHALLIKSEVSPEAPFTTDISWHQLDAPTAKEQAELNKIKAETGTVYVNAGVIDPTEERQRLINDPDAGYNGLPDQEPEAGEEELFPEEESEGENIAGAAGVAAGGPVTAEGNGIIQDTAMNGAQVQALVDIVMQVAQGQLPRDSGIEMIITAFPVSREEASRIMGSAGGSFTPSAPEPEKTEFQQE